MGSCWQGTHSAFVITLFLSFYPLLLLYGSQLTRIFILLHTLFICSVSILLSMSMVIIKGVGTIVPNKVWTCSLLAVVYIDNWLHYILLEDDTLCFLALPSRDPKWVTMPTSSTAYSWIEIQLGSQWSSEICLPTSSGLSLIPQQVFQSFPYSQNQVHAPSQSLLASLSIPLRIMSHQLRTSSASCLYRSKCLCIHTDLFIFCPVSKK